jgi:hypothetical protein
MLFLEKVILKIKEFRLKRIRKENSGLRRQLAVLISRKRTQEMDRLTAEAKEELSKVTSPIKRYFLYAKLYKILAFALIKRAYKEVRYQVENRWDNVCTFFANVREFINKLIVYVPFLWKDRDWDYGFLEQMLMIKLNRMAKNIESNDYIESSKRVAKQIRYAVYLLERIRSNYDLNAAIAKHEAKWGVSYRTHKVHEKNPEYYVWEVHYPNAVTEELKQEAHKDIDAAYRYIAKKESELYDRLFKHLRRYWTGFWD